jgi:hypothetical protein
MGGGATYALFTDKSETSTTEISVKAPPATPGPFGSPIGPLSTEDFESSAKTPEGVPEEVNPAQDDLLRKLIDLESDSQPDGSEAENEAPEQPPPKKIEDASLATNKAEGG